MEWTTATERRHAAGVPTHRTVKWCVNHLNHQVSFCGLLSTAGVTAVVYNYTALIKNRNL